MLIKMTFKEWWNKKEAEFSKSYEYNNRGMFFARLWLLNFLTLVFIALVNRTIPSYIIGIASMFLGLSVVFYFIFIWPSYVTKFVYIATRIYYRQSDGDLTQELIMYKWDNKLFFSLSDIEVYEEFGGEGIKFIDLKNKKRIKEKVDTAKVWESIKKTPVNSDVDIIRFILDSGNGLSPKQVADRVDVGTLHEMYINQEHFILKRLEFMVEKEQLEFRNGVYIISKAFNDRMNTPIVLKEAK